MGNNVSGVLNGILEDYKAIALEAVKDAAHKGQEDIMNEAKKYLQEYYNNYSPRMYKRKYALKRAILPYWGDKTGANGISITIGIQYNAGALKGAYKSNSAYHQSGGAWRSVPGEVKNNSDLFSSDFGTPDPDWILSNYLEGEHGGYYSDGQGTSEKMNRFFDTELPARLEKYIQSSLLGAIASRL